MSKKIKMLRTVPGSLDGIHAALFKKDEVYDIPERLAHAFVDQMKAAMYITDSSTEKKMILDAPWNKSMDDIDYDNKTVIKKSRGRPKNRKP